MGYEFNSDGRLIRLSDGRLFSNENSIAFKVFIKRALKRGGRVSATAAAMDPAKHFGRNRDWPNNDRYRKLIDAVDSYIEGILQWQENLVKIAIPGGEGDTRSMYEEPVGVETNFIFISPNLEQKEKIMIILNGSTQMPGMLSRFMTLNSTIQQGTQLPHIRKAI